MKVGIPKESESRVAGTPDFAKKLIKRGLKVCVESGAGEAAGFPDSEYTAMGAEITDRAGAWGSDIVAHIARPSDAETALLKKGAGLVCLMEPFRQDGLPEKLAARGVSVLSLELIPRTSRAQSMDVLSSQANIAGYRAVLEASTHYGRFFPVMMTSAGMAKAAKLIVLGVGVAGLQAIATARRLGASVEAFDIRPETREQILSLGAKPIDLDLGESGAGAGGYAKELSEEARKRQQLLLMERLKKADVIITTALVPGRKAPVLVTEDAVRGMRAGSVIVDMAAAQGGNCPLTEAGKVVKKNGVTLVGLTNYLSLVPADASLFFGNNIVNLLDLVVKKSDSGVRVEYDLKDDIVEASLMVHDGTVRKGAK